MSARLRHLPWPMSALPIPILLRAAPPIAGPLRAIRIDELQIRQAFKTATCCRRRQRGRYRWLNTPPHPPASSAVVVGFGGQCASSVVSDLRSSIARWSEARMFSQLCRSSSEALESTSMQYRRNPDHAASTDSNAAARGSDGPPRQTTSVAHRHPSPQTTGLDRRALGPTDRSRPRRGHPGLGAPRERRRCRSRRRPGRRDHRPSAQGRRG